MPINTANDNKWLCSTFNFDTRYFVVAILHITWAGVVCRFFFFLIRFLSGRFVLFIHFGLLPMHREYDWCWTELRLNIGANRMKNYAQKLRILSWWLVFVYVSVYFQWFSICFSGVLICKTPFNHPTKTGPNASIQIQFSVASISQFSLGSFVLVPRHVRFYSVLFFFSSFHYSVAFVFYSLGLSVFVSDYVRVWLINLLGNSFYGFAFTFVYSNNDSISVFHISWIFDCCVCLCVCVYKFISCDLVLIRILVLQNIGVLGFWRVYLSLWLFALFRFGTVRCI